VRDKSHLYPTRIFVDKVSLDDSLTHRVLANLKEAEVVEVDGVKDPVREGLMQASSTSPEELFTAGKRALYLTRHKGSWLKSCPGTSGHVCCNLFIVNPGEGCPLDCTYCYLQSYLKKNPTLKLYTNTSDLMSELQEKFLSDSSRLFRVGTGELIDSLVWDDISGLSLDLVPFFAKFDNAVLELKTKDDGVGNLLDLKNDHKGKTVVSWSVNARTVTEKDEKDTATLAQRIEAACKVVEAGYRVGFHFDPLVYFENWEEEYLETINTIFSNIPASRVAWISISTLRYKTDLHQMMKARFPESNLPFGEQFLANDNKLRYVQPIRFKMTRFVWNNIKKISEDIPVYMCMESSAAWRNISGGAPLAGSELKEVFARNHRLPVLT
jgi:spore photoproduct lyase